MLLSVVIPVFNEEDVVPPLLDALLPVLTSLGHPWELVFVDDGSVDNTRRILAEASSSDPRIKILGFSRNFGHQAAITAGLDFAEGDAVVVMDADLQDPPELLPEMLKAYEQGFDVVSAQRISREGEGLFKRGTAALFYSVMQHAIDKRLSPQVGDFRLFSRTAVQALRRFREQHRFMRGLVAWLGLKEAIIPFERAPRVAGTTKYPFWKMMRFAWTAISSFSALPLKLSLYGGLIMTACGMGCCLYVLYEALVLRSTVQGWSSMICLQVLFNGAILTAIGLVGDYVARIYDESKGRPLYVLTDMLNFELRTVQPARSITCFRSRDPVDTEHLSSTSSVRQIESNSAFATQTGATL